MRTRGAGIRTVTFLDIENALPSVRPLRADLLVPDIFLCALGFEERAVAYAGRFVTQAARSGLKGKTAVRFVYSNNAAENIVNAEALKLTLAQSFVDVLSLGADDPSEVRRELLNLIDQYSLRQPKVCIVFDISAASGNLIMSVIASLAQASATHDLDLQIVYAEARRYYPLHEDFLNHLEQVLVQACEVGSPSSLQEYGVADVEINELYAGLPQENQQEFVIALPAYRTERLTRCLQHLTNEALSVVRDDVHWILGCPPIDSMSWRLELQKRIVGTLLRGLSEPLDEWVLTPALYSITSTLDYRGTIAKILELVDGKPAHNISVVHMGSKMQGIGVALALTARREVAVCYARPTGFNPKQYSTGVGAFSEILMSDLSQVLRLIKSVGTLQMVPNVETERSGLPPF